VSDLSDPNLPAWLAPLEKEQAVFLARLAPEESQWRLRWPRDSLHQWSRPWECMYVASAAPPAPARILDAGAGFGFFPYYWASLGYKVDAVDCDRRLGAHHARARTAFAALKEGVPGPRGEVVFDVQDLRSLSFADSTFDMVYSVSVLEHIATDRKSVLRELARVVKPGGVVVITCDLSLDAQSEIKMVPFLTLLSEVESVFEYAVEPVFRFGPDVLTTDSVRYRSPERLPWRPPPFRPVWLLNPLFYLKHRRYSEADFYSLAVVGMKLRKKV
jgi:SAM-dependent methyltransferase